MNSINDRFAPALLACACSAGVMWSSVAQASDSCFPTSAIRFKPQAVAMPSRTSAKPESTQESTKKSAESLDMVNNVLGATGVLAVGKQINNFSGAKMLAVPAAVVTTVEAYKNGQDRSERSGYEKAAPALEAVRANAALASALGKIPKGAYALTSVAVDSSKAGLAIQKIAEADGYASADDYGKAATHSIDAAVKITLAVGGAKVFKNNAGADRAVAAYEGAQYIANAAVGRQIDSHFAEVDAQIDAQADMDLADKMQAALARRASRTGTQPSSGVAIPYR